MLDVDCGNREECANEQKNTASRKVFCKYIVQGPGWGRGQQGDGPGQRDLDPRAAGLRGAEPQRAAAVHQPPPPPQPLHLLQDLPPQGPPAEEEGAEPKAGMFVRFQQLSSK